ncbi:MAG: hypothetical protein RDU20_00625 [Desulfomonilaceae bacterium]|nr:hypothetical protein [Desulfomonilaceae bacterium]
MSDSSPSNDVCPLCGANEAAGAGEPKELCAECQAKSQALFNEEMRRVELIRTIRGRDVELYDIKHPTSPADHNHCGQVILIKAGQGFEVKICLRSNTVAWMENLFDERAGFSSFDTRLDALIGNVSLLIDSWGGGPYYMDIFEVDSVVSTEGEI